MIRKKRVRRERRRRKTGPAAGLTAEKPELSKRGAAPGTLKKNRSLPLPESEATTGADLPSRGRKRLFRARYAAVFFAVVALALYYAYSIVQVEMEQSRAEAEKAALLAEKARLEEELEHVTDPAYIEQQARMELRMIRPGEILYILPEKDPEEEWGEGDGPAHGE